MSIVNDKPTPETNSAIKEQAGWMRPFVSTTFDGITYDSPVATLCRKLERERDEARQQIAKLLNKLDQLYRDVEIDKLKEGAK